MEDTREDAKILKIQRYKERCGDLYVFLGSVRKVYAPLFFVSSQQGFGVTDIKAPLGGSQLSGLGQTVYSS